MRLKHFSDARQRCAADRTTLVAWIENMGRVGAVATRENPSSRAGVIPKVASHRISTEEKNVL